MLFKSWDKVNPKICIFKSLDGNEVLILELSCLSEHPGIMERKEISTQHGLKQLPRGKHDVPEKMQEK